MAAPAPAAPAPAPAPAPTEFAPARFLQRPDAATQTQGASAQVQDQHQEQDWRAKPALLILNQPVASLDLLHRLWAHTGYRLCADGGANRLYDTFDGLPDADARRADFLPTVIHGDLDSLRDDVRAYYASHGVAISRDPDQYSTDFGKAIEQITAAVPPPSLSSPPTPGSQRCREILILCTLGGRVDQGLGLLYEMLRTQNAHGDGTRLWLFSESSVSFILPPGESIIHAPVAAAHRPDAAAAAFFTKNVGILPAFGPATISTTGLVWDVTAWPTSPDGNVSTSNHVKRSPVTLTTDAKVLFTIERAADLP